MHFFFSLRLLLKLVPLGRNMFLQMSAVAFSWPNQSTSFLSFSSVYQARCTADHSPKEANWEDSRLPLLPLSPPVSPVHPQSRTFDSLLLLLFLCSEICSHPCCLFEFTEVTASLNVKYGSVSTLNFPQTQCFLPSMQNTLGTLDTYSSENSHGENYFISLNLSFPLHSYSIHALN